MIRIRAKNSTYALPDRGGFTITATCVDVVAVSMMADDRLSPSSRSRKKRHATRLPAICAITHFHPVSPSLFYITPPPLLPHSTQPPPRAISHTLQSTRPDKMSCKRKRSADDSPVSVSSFGAVSTPGAQSPISFPSTFQGSMQMDVDSSARHNGWDFASASRVKGGDWGNRTRKRFRDNRADERAIHGMPPQTCNLPLQSTDCIQRTHYRNSSRHNATTQTHRPCHQTLYPVNSLL
jgi:hypothetical protein